MKFNWDEILIIGGSVAQYRTEYDHWPKHLTCLLTGQDLNIDTVPRGIGISGCSWWSVKRHLEHELKKSIPKVLIVCHSESTRIPNDNDLPLNASVMMFKKNQLLENIIDEKNLNRKIIVASKYYYQYLMSFDFHIWAHKKWFEELDTLTENIPYVIHLLQESEQYDFKNGITLEQSLEDLLSLPFWSDIPNHFTPEENIKFAKSLYTLITNFQSNGITRLDW